MQTTAVLGSKIIFLAVALLCIPLISSHASADRPLARVGNPHASAEHQKSELVLGSVAMDVPAVMHRRLRPLTRHLARELDRPVRLKLAPSMRVAINELARGKVDISYLTPVAYIRAHQAGKVRLVAKTVTKGKASFQLMIVVKQDSAIRSVADLAGKSFAFGDKAALLQRATVVGAGMPLDSLGDYKFIGHYDNIVRGVMNGDFDAGILKDTMAFKWKDKGIRILHATAQLPPYNISVSASVDDATFSALQRVFLALDNDDPQHLLVIKALDAKYDGFAPTSDHEYDIVRELVAPFEPSR